jgi:hypothetical protein
MTPADRLLELHEELGKGKVVEARLQATDVHLDGLCDYGSKTIYIDPRTATVSALLHELLHRRHPSWQEHRVVREEKRLIRNMTTKEVSRWYRNYQLVKRTRQRTKHVED